MSSMLNQCEAGSEIKEQICRIENIRQVKDGFSFTCKDSSGSIGAWVAERLYTKEQLTELSAKPVSITGVVLAKSCNHKEIKVKVINPAESTSFDVDQLWKNISDEKLDTYISTIRYYIDKVQNPRYKELLALHYSNENIKRMRTMPATHIRQGSLGGGMLHEIATVTLACVAMANHYSKMANGIYSFPIDWDLLLTGALMHLAGNFLYFNEEPPHLKSSLGVNQGYASCEQGMIYYYVYSQGVALSAEELSMLLGVVAQCNEFRAGAKACCQEAIILHSVYNMYAYLDRYDHALSDAIAQFGTNDKAALQEYIYGSAINSYASESTIAKMLKEGGE